MTRRYEGEPALKLLGAARVPGMELRKRMVRLATAEWLSAPSSTLLPDWADAIPKRARGGVGLIVLSHRFVRPDGKAGRGMVSLWKDDQIPAVGGAICAYFNLCSKNRQEPTRCWVD